MKKVVYFAFSLLIAFLDQITKHWALSQLYFYRPKAVLPILNMTLAYNTGAAFSFLSQTGNWHRIFFTIFSSIMVLILSLWLIQLRKEAFYQAIGISLILGGALGNVIDRIQLGFVVDFIDLHYKTHHFPIFNLADASICLGAALLLFCFVRKIE